MGAAILTALGAGIFWLLLLRRQRVRVTEPRVLLAILIAVGLCGRMCFAFLTPTFYAPDEEAHYKYVRHLAEQHAFPVQTTKPGDGTNDFEYNQPPLYYLLLTPVFWLGHAVFGSVTATVIMMRLVSIGLWGVNVWAAILWLRRMAITDPKIRIFVLGMVCLLPTYVFVSAMINNDNLLITLGGLLLVLLAENRGTIKNSIATGLTLGLALLTKQSACVFVPAIVWLTLTDAYQKRASWTRAVGTIVLVGGCAALLFIPRAYWNFKTYGRFTPEYLVVIPVTWPSLAYGLASTVHNVVKTFWAVSGISNNVGYPFPLPGMLLLGASGLILLRKLGRQIPIHRASERVNLMMIAALALMVCINFGLVLRFGYVSGMGQGRHLFPLLFPIAGALAGGLRTLSIKHFPVQATGFWVTYAAVFVAFSLERFAVLAAAAP